MTYIHTHTDRQSLLEDASRIKKPWIWANLALNCPNFGQIFFSESGLSQGCHKIEKWIPAKNHENSDGFPEILQQELAKKHDFPAFPAFPAQPISNKYLPSKKISIHYLYLSTRMTGTLGWGLMGAPILTKQGGLSSFTQCPPTTNYPYSWNDTISAKVDQWGNS